MPLWDTSERVTHTNLSVVTTFTHDDLVCTSHVGKMNVFPQIQPTVFRRLVAQSD